MPKPKKRRFVRVGAVLVYVDDLLMSLELKNLQSFIKRLQQTWKTSEAELLGLNVETMRFLGYEMEYQGENQDLVIHQQPYIIELLEDFCPQLMLKGRGNPGEPESFAKSEAKKELMEEDPLETAKLSSVLGRLLWVALRSRPDVAWTVNRAASQAAKEPALARTRIRHALQYLYHTLDYTLEYKRVEGCPSQLVLYTDASLSPTGSQSQQGILLMLGNEEQSTTITWQTSRQTLTALSSAEAELIALVAGCQLALMLRALVEEYMGTEIPIVARCDNAAVVMIAAKESSNGPRTRHLSMRAAWLRYLQSSGNAVIEFVDTLCQKADALTKGLASLVMPRVRTDLGLVL